MPLQPYISIKGLSKRYRNAHTDAVRAIDLDIEQHDIFGLLGPNGAGKTTTISILCKQLEPTSGKVIINGFDASRQGEQIKKIIGVVPQEIALYPRLTAYENLRFFGNLYGLSGKGLRQTIYDYLDTFGLRERMHDALGNYSGGMKRRVNLIAGIMHRPQVIFLDEPTVGIDVHSKTVIIEYLKKLNREGATIVYTSHHMEEAEQFCTSIAIIDQGTIIAKGSPEALINEHEHCHKLEDIFLKLTGRKLRD